MIIGDKGMTALPMDVENSGMIIMTIGNEAMTDKVAVEERNGTEEEVKVMGIEVGVAGGTPMSNTLPRVTIQVHIIKIQITTALRPWGIKLHGRHNTQRIHNNHHTKGDIHPHARNKCQTFASYAKTQDIMTINANLLVTLCREHRRHSVKADHIII